VRIVDEHVTEQYLRPLRITLPGRDTGTEPGDGRPLARSGRRRSKHLDEMGQIRESGGVLLCAEQQP
jgi:hypothetical protein